MLICLATYRERLAVLLENAAELRLFEFAQGTWNVRGFSPRPEDCPAGLVRLLGGAGASLLVCGGVRAPHLQYLRGTGLEVLPWICGSVREVLAGLARGDLSGMVMPGCGYEKPKCLDSLHAPRSKGRRVRGAVPGEAATGLGA